MSLLCTNYKILSKVLATTMRKTMQEVIHCVPGRSMVDNIHLIQDVLDISSLLGLDTSLISPDQKKAFDHVEHRFLYKTMERLGFCMGFTGKIQALYGGIECIQSMPPYNA